MVEDIQERFGTAVRAQRKSLRISQEELAGRAGLHRTYVADVERGARNLSLASIEKLAKALGLSISTLFSHALGGKTDFESGSVEILLVEDNPGDVELTLAAFKSANLINKIQVIRDGAEALEFLFGTGRYARRSASDRPQIILLDLKLAKLSGLEVLRQIKAREETRTIPVIVLTGSQRQQDVSESLRLGAATYLVKPVDFHRFANVVPQLKLCWALLRLVSQPGR